MAILSCGMFFFCIMACKYIPNDPIALHNPGFNLVISQVPEVLSDLIEYF